jgi:hypothetical protein
MVSASAARANVHKQLQPGVRVDRLRAGAIADWHQKYTQQRQHAKDGHAISPPADRHADGG